MSEDQNTLWRRQQASVAQGCLTNSKHPDSHVRGVFPTHVDSGNGAIVRSSNGKSYIDFICGLGTNLFGMGHPELVDVVCRVVRGGVSFSLPTPYELEAAEAIKSTITFVDKVKFLKSGSDACSAAVRFARAATGRKLILSEGYHGWHDTFVALAPPAKGVAADFSLPLTADYQSLDGSTIAAVILEPVITDISEARRAWLGELRAWCTKHGVVLIFDEVITGYRVPGYSIAQMWDIYPDLIVLGKAIGAGHALAAVAGPSSIMDDRQVFISTTYAGETLSLAVCAAAIGLLKGRKHSLQDLWDKSAVMQAAFNNLPGDVKMVGYPTRGVLFGGPLAKALFLQEMCRAGFLLCGSWFTSFPLVDFFDRYLEAAGDVLNKIAGGDVKLLGSLPTTPFAQQMRVKS